MRQEIEGERRALLDTLNGHCSSSSTCQKEERTPPFTRPIALCLLLYFLVEMYDMITVAPLTALLEQAVCRTYYQIHDPSLVAPGGSVPESLCKLNHIQAEIAIIRGWKLAFDALPVFLVAIPFGKVADRVGRKTVFVLSIIGLVLSTIWILTICIFYTVFPIQLVWLSSLFTLCGGGLFGANSMIFTMSADCCSEIERSRIFYYMYSAYLCTELLAPWLASVIMNISVRSPFVLSVIFLFLSLPVIGMMPDTRIFSTPDIPQSVVSGIDVSPDTVTGALGDVGSSETQLGRSESLTESLWSRNIALAGPIFFVGLLRPSTLNVLIQYTSKTFHWKLSQAVTLLSEVAAVNLILFLVVVPQGMKLVRRKYDLPQQVIDLSVVRGSMLFLSVGALCLGLAPNMPSVLISVFVFAFGFGCRVSILSLVTSWVSSTMRGRLYGVIQIIENMGLLVAEPLLQNVFAASLKLSEHWSSLAFYIASALYAAAGICTVFIHLDLKGPDWRVLQE